MPIDATIMSRKKKPLKFTFFNKLKKLINNPRKYPIKAIIEDQIYHKINDLAHPSLFPKSIFGKCLGNRNRYFLYNNLYSIYPLFERIIKLDKDYLSNKKSFRGSNKYSSINATKKTDIENIDHFQSLIYEGIEYRHNFLDNQTASNIRNEIKLLSKDKNRTKYSYDNQTFFYSFNLECISSELIDKLTSRVNILSDILFEKDHYPKCSLELIRSGDTDIKDPNTILHVDRMIPALKAFYFPFQVNLDQSPFVFSPKSHIIDFDHLKNMLIAYQNYAKVKSGPFIMPESYESRYKEKPIVVPCNTLVFALTNGLHRRYGFSKPSQQRWSFRFEWYSSISKLDASVSKLKSKLNL